MFEILMLLGFFYGGFCYLLPERKHPVKPAPPKQGKNLFPVQATPAKPRQTGPHSPTCDKRYPEAQKTFSSRPFSRQRKLCKAGRLC